MKPSDVGQQLAKIVKCDISWDGYIRNFYSVDASSYTIKPQVVAFPRNESDVIKIIKFAKRYHVSITPRGAGTGLVGSALGRGIILDMRNFDKIKLGADHINVGSGVFKGCLDKILKKQGRILGPDPSIGPFCTMGGMIGTNASGIHSLRYGSVIDNIIQVKMIDSFGSIIKLPGKYKPDIIKKIHQRNNTFPKVSKNSCGYRIDKVFSEKDLHKLIAGSEGTLGIVTGAKLRTYPSPKNILLHVIHYKTISDAAKDVPKILDLKPSAVELVDSNIIKHIKMTVPSTGCLLFVELDNISQQNRKQIHKIISGKIIKTESSAVKIKKIWSFRNSALAYSLQSITKNETMPTLIEDAVVPVKRLSLLLQILDMVCKKYALKV
ncbi:MAG: FAD-binding oxidoreductase, partial [Nitrosotalea sp.]